MKGRVLVAGFSTRHVAQSAARAGYEVCAVDHFCDQDLSWCTRDRIAFGDLDDLPDAVDRMAGRYAFDFLVVTSGAEDLATAVPVCGTERSRIGRFLDKLDTQAFFEGLGVPVPRLRARDEYPYMIKPRRGAGGWRNAVIGNDAELDTWINLYGEIPSIRQEIVDGIPASTCCITDGTTARVIAANEQFLRGTGESAYGFCGSVTPFDHPARDRMVALSERIAAASGCRGCIGIDFVIAGDVPYAIEVNPRFQGTLETIEAAYGCSLFDLHVRACSGLSPGTVPDRQQYAARTILFADRDMTLAADLKGLAPVVADIPWPGTSFEKDQAIVSVFGNGPTREEALRALDKNITTVRQYMR